MPIYEYQCEKCEQVHELMQKLSDPPLTECPSCQGPTRKLMSHTSFVLKGSGWYSTDYKKSSSSSSSTPGSSSTPTTAT